MDATTISSILAKFPEAASNLIGILHNLFRFSFNDLAKAAMGRRRRHTVIVLRGADAASNADSA